MVIQVEKECVIKYVSILNDSRNRENTETPHRHITRHDKQDELCCNDMRDSIIKFIYEGVYEENNSEDVGVILYHGGSEIFKAFNHCPFCGAKIVYKETEKMKYVNRPMDNWVLVSEECEMDEPHNDS